MYELLQGLAVVIKRFVCRSQKKKTFIETTLKRVLN